MTVSVLVPVRNGEDGLDRAIESLTRQTHGDLDIIISNNHSEDDTAKIISSWCERDERIRAVKPPELLPAMDHVMWLLGMADNEYVCFAAHDDDRSFNFVEKLVEALDGSESACLAFCEVLVEDEKENRSKLEFDFETSGLGVASRVRKAVLLQCFHFYGLWRTETLKGIPKVTCDWWMDTPLMASAAVMGEFVKAPDAAFVYRNAGGFSKGKANYHLLKKKRAAYPVRVGGLLYAVFCNVIQTGGILMALWACVCVVEKQLRGIPRWLRAKRG